MIRRVQCYGQGEGLGRCVVEQRLQQVVVWYLSQYVICTGDLYTLRSNRAIRNEPTETSETVSNTCQYSPQTCVCDSHHIAWWFRYERSGQISSAGECDSVQVTPPPAVCNCKD